MSRFVDGIEWILTASNWDGASGIGHRLVQHLWYSLLATAAATAVGLPIGLAIGHSGRGRFFASATAGVFRAIPTFAVVALLFRWRPLSLWPVLIALVLLAIPPVMLNAAAGVDSVDPDARDAARGMGLTSWQVLTRVEFPCALPLVMAGVRSAANQVIATATVAGTIGLGGLGRFIFTGYATQRYGVVFGATILVVVLVLVVELLFAIAQRRAVSPGLRPRGNRWWRTVPLTSPASPPATPVPLGGKS